MNTADMKPADSDKAPILVEIGEDPRVLIISFTGFKGGHMISAFDFLRISKLLKYSRIMLADTTKTCYFGGVPPVAPDYAALCKLLNDNIAKLKPEKILCIGRSGGATAALLFGHELNADYIHAFSPYTYVDLANIEKYQDPEGLEYRLGALNRIQALPREVHKLFDLKKVLMRSNGKSRYYVHVCTKSKWDSLRAKHLLGCPGVDIISYPCDNHGVAIVLAKADLLPELLRIENQDRIGEVLAERMGVTQFNH